VKTLGKERELKDVQSFGAVKFSWPFIDSYSIEEHTCIEMVKMLLGRMVGFTLMNFICTAPWGKGVYEQQS